MIQPTPTGLKAIGELFELTVQAQAILDAFGKGFPSPVDPEKLRAISERLIALRHPVQDFLKPPILTKETTTDILKSCDALWLHSGDPKSPHAVTTKGDCTDGFINTLMALKHTRYCELFAHQLVRLLRLHYDGPIHWVIGSDHAGAVLSHDVARLLDAQHDFTEKGPDKTQLWKRFIIKPGEIVLQVEELITTTSTLKAVREGIRAGNPYPVTFAPLSLALVHRSDVYEFEGSPIVHAVHYDIKTWKKEECPHCASGSKRILEPKKHWAELTGRAV